MQVKYVRKTAAVSVSKAFKSKVVKGFLCSIYLVMKCTF